MLEQSWSDGYVVDVDYTRGYYRDLAPGLLRFVALLGSSRPPEPDAPFTYYELGCGQGLSTVLHAAANPAGRFFGVDFNPTHIGNAQRLAREARIENVQFLEKSFGELLDMPLEDADFVTLHGVWSWIAPEHRAHIVEFMRRRLKPGGIAFVSYNCLPGIAQIAPLQRMLHEAAALRPGERLDTMREALVFAQRLKEAGARFFQLNPLAAARLADVARQDPHYVVHEFFNANWSPSYHADLARDLSAAKLTYAGSALIAENFEQFMLAPDIAKLVAQIGDRTVAETMKDFARSPMFRRDVFSRGAGRAGQPELEALLNRTRFVLARPRARCRLRAAGPVGEVSLREDMHTPLLEALARAPMTFDDIARSPEASHIERGRLRTSLFGLAALGNVLPAQSLDDERLARESTSRFNRVALSMPITGSGSTYLASPVLGSGLSVDFVERILMQGPRSEPEALAHARSALSQLDLKAFKAGKPVEAGAEVDGAIAERSRIFFAETLPFYRQLGLVD